MLWFWSLLYETVYCKGFEIKFKSNNIDRHVNKLFVIIQCNIIFYDIDEIMLIYKQRIQ